MGRPRKYAESAQFSFRLEKNDLERLREIAEEQEKLPTELAREILQRYIKRQKPKGTA